MLVRFFRNRVRYGLEVAATGIHCLMTKAGWDHIVASDDALPSPSLVDITFPKYLYVPAHATYMLSGHYTA